MYPQIRDGQPAGVAGDRRSSPARVARNVWLLGLTSLFTDVSSEMLTAVLPLYLLLELRLTPLEFGIIEGVYQGTSAVVRVAAGAFADATRRLKHVAVAGYALSTLSRLGLVIVSTSGAGLTSLLLVDRFGKGIRTAPRDALIALSSDRGRLGRAFGVHRALDTVGAVVGPLLAFGVLAVAARAYHAVFAVSLAFAVVGLAIIGLFVEDRRRDTTAERPRAPVTSVISSAPFRRIFLSGCLVSACTATDGLIYGLLQQRGSVPATLFPLLFVGTASVYLLLAYPFGKLADRVGRSRLFVAGHLAIAGVYAAIGPLGVTGTMSIAITCLLLGVYYAATDGVLSALAGGVLEASHMTTGLALVSTGVAVARLAAAAAFGALWGSVGPDAALTVFTAALAIAATASTFLLAMPPAASGAARS